MMPPGPHVCPRCLWAVHRNQLHMFAHVCAHAKTPELVLLCQHGNKAARKSQRDERSIPFLQLVTVQFIDLTLENIDIYLYGHRFLFFLLLPFSGEPCFQAHFTVLDLD